MGLRAHFGNNFSGPTASGVGKPFNARARARCQETNPAAQHHSALRTQAAARRPTKTAKHERAIGHGTGRVHSGTLGILALSAFST